jgi:hypothetical protein
MRSILSTPGMMKKIPGPFAPISLPRRKMTPRSYSRRILMATAAMIMRKMIKKKIAGGIPQPKNCFLSKSFISIRIYLKEFAQEDLIFLPFHLVFSSLLGQNGHLPVPRTSSMSTKPSNSFRQFKVSVTTMYGQLLSQDIFLRENLKRS